MKLNLNNTLNLRCLTSYLAVFAVITLGVAWGVYHLFCFIPFAGLGIDDANIFFVYGRHIREGFGFVYNTGGERVEGFTSLAWVLVCAGAFFFRSPEKTLLLFNTLMISLVLTAFFIRLARQEQDGRKGVFIPLTALAMLAWVFTSPEYFSWCVLSLMETGLWSAMLIACLVTLAGSACGSRACGALFPVFLGVLLLVRPESMAWGAGFVALRFLLALVQSGAFRNALSRALPSALAYGIVLGGLTAFRLLYFGFPFPNTYYAKVSPDRLYSLQEGWNYFSAFLKTDGWILWFVAAAALVAVAWTLVGGISIFRRRCLRLNEWDVMAYLASIGCLVGLAIPIWVGGDHFASFRFFQPIWPLLPVPLLYIFTRSTRWLADRITPRREPASNRLRWVAAGINLLLALLLARSFLLSAGAHWNQLEKTSLNVDFEVAHDGRLFGEALNRLFDGMPPPSVGAITAGGFKFSYTGEVVDLMGLNNVAMGHAPGERKGIKNHAAFNKEVFYQLQPNIMPLNLLRADEIGTELMWDHPQVQRCVQHKWARLPLKDLFTDAPFREAYTLVFISRRDDPGARGLLAFVENNHLSSLLTRDSLNVMISEPDAHP